MIEAEQQPDDLQDAEVQPGPETAAALPRQRLRLRYRKDEVLMYIGHLDLIKLLGRWFRRAEIPYATSGYFSPKPRISFGPILPLGAIGENELLDLELREGLTWSSPQILATLDRLREVSAPREFAQELVELDAGVPNIARQARYARYELQIESGAEVLTNESLEGPMPFTDQKGRELDLSRGLLHHRLAGGSLEVTGGCGGEQHLNPFLLQRYLSGKLSVRFGLVRRLQLLDSELNPL